MKSKASPGHVWVEDCRCREVLIDYVRGTIFHPFATCPHHGQETPMIEDTAPL